MKQNMVFTAFIAVLISACSSNATQDLQLTDLTAKDADILINESEKNKTPSPVFQNSPPSIGFVDTTSMQVQNFDSNILQSGGPVIDWDKKIIKTANIILEIKEYAAYNNAIHIKLKNYGAYIAQENQNETEEQIVNDVTIKVPVDMFEDLMNSLEGDGIKMLEKSISTADVTGEVIDTKARLEAKKQVRSKYLELLKQAKNMDEILQVQNEINSIQEAIESANGRVDYLNHAAAYSTIQLKYYQFLNGLTSKDIKPTFISQVIDAFKKGATVIKAIFLFFISAWPLVFTAIALYIILKNKRNIKSVSKV